jgi:transcriptional regulator with XRE-family HTH domain
MEVVKQLPDGAMPAAEIGEEVLDAPLMGELGRRVRSLREARGMSLRQLGASSGLSASFLSGIERGASSPSISSLASLAEALGVTLSDLFLVAERPAQVVRERERIAFRLADAPVEYVRLAAALRDRSIEPMIVTLPPRFAPQEAVFIHKGEEFGMVLSGVLNIVVGGQSHELSSGDTIHFRSDVPHSWSNCADQPVVMLWVTTPRLF